MKVPIEMGVLRDEWTVRRCPDAVGNETRASLAFQSILQVRIPLYCSWVRRGECLEVLIGFLSNVILQDSVVVGGEILDS